MDYPVETFTKEERALLEPHFTNLDRPVFALVNMPETVKGALFARYSRYQGTLRRLFLDEFAEDLPPPGQRWDAVEGARAATLAVMVGGDDVIHRTILALDLNQKTCSSKLESILKHLTDVNDATQS